MIELSIILPAYNVEKYLDVCISSLYRQGLDEAKFEVIIVNDGSTDGTLNFIESLAKEHQNIVVVDKQNGGQSRARNVGLQKAMGEYILFVDSDDVIIDGTIFTLLAAAKAHNTDMCRGAFVKMTDEEIEQGLPMNDNNNIDIQSLKMKTGLQSFIEDYDPDYSYAVLFIFRRSFLNDNDIAFLEGKLFEDVAFTLDAYVMCGRFVDVPLPFYVYRQRVGSTMSTMNVKKLKDMNSIIQHALNLSPLVEHDARALAKLRFAAFRSSSIVVWYLCNYRSLYPHVNEVVADLKSKIGTLRFNGDVKQRLFSFCVNYIPYIYISIRYLMAKHKYN